MAFYQDPEKRDSDIGYATWGLYQQIMLVIEHYLELYRSGHSNSLVFRAERDFFKMFGLYLDQLSIDHIFHNLVNNPDLFNTHNIGESLYTTLYHTILKKVDNDDTVYNEVDTAVQSIRVTARRLALTCSSVITTPL